ncbi:MAG: hypothetical protein AB8G05_19340 [Oligoflexales bacterium]
MQQLAKISLFLKKNRVEQMRQILLQAGVRDIFHTSGSMPRLNHKSFLPSFLNSPIAYDPGEYLSFLIPVNEEKNCINYLMTAVNGVDQRWGTIFSQHVSLKQGDKNAFINTSLEFKNDLDPEQVKLHEDLIGITCIVQRGASESISRVALESSAVPLITYGNGTGLRNKLGLLRITIPAEKEILRFIVHSGDVDYFLAMLIKKGQLDQPGKGFVYTWPISLGTSPLLAIQDAGGQAASIEQIIAAIDNLAGGVNWREKNLEEGHEQYSYFSGVDLNLICNEGFSNDLVSKAMVAGLGGATIEQWDLSDCSAIGKQVSLARELCTMTVAPQALEKVIENMTENQAFNSSCQGFVLQGESSQAFTYIKKKVA